MSNIYKKRDQRRNLRAQRIRAGLVVTSDRPRLSVARSLKHISAQIIDQSGNVLAQASDVQIKGLGGKNGVARAQATGKLLAEKAVAKKLKLVVFDKGPYKYHGRVKALADGAREGGLEF